MVWSLGKSDKRIVLYIRQMSGIPTVIKQSKISPVANQVGYRNLKFPFDVGKPSFRMRNTFYYAVDISCGQLSFNEPVGTISPELLDIIIGKNIIKQIVSKLEETPTTTVLIMIFLGALVGLAGGYIIGNFLPM